MRFYIQDDIETKLEIKKFDQLRFIENPNITKGRVSLQAEIEETSQISSFIIKKTSLKVLPFLTNKEVFLKDDCDICNSCEGTGYLSELDQRECKDCFASGHKEKSNH